MTSQRHEIGIKKFFRTKTQKTYGFFKALYSMVKRGKIILAGLEGVVCLLKRKCLEPGL